MMAHARTPTPNSLMLLDGGSFIEDSSPRTSSGRKKVIRQESSSSLEILPPEDNGVASSRDGPDYDNQRPPSSQRVDSALRRTPTPTKQVALQAVRRKEDRDEVEVGQLGLGFGPVGRIHQKDLQKNSTHRHRCCAESNEKENRHSSHEHGANKSSSKRSTRSREPTSQVAYDSRSKDSTKSPAKVSNSKPVDDIGNSDEFDTDLEDGQEGESQEEEVEKPTAPNQLLMEFLECMMQHDYVNAKKLCTMILLYEPNNSEAQKFQPLIEEKLALDAEAEAEREEGSSDDDDDSDDDSDSDVESGDSSEDEEYETEEEEEVVREDSSKPDSGISSATELF